VIKEQKAKMHAQEKALFKRARKLLIRDENLVKQTEQQRIEAMLERNPRIKMIYEKSLELQAIWKNHPGSRFQEKLQSLSEWCHQAEMSGVASLEAFAANLKQYSLAKA
jgi:tRNA(His) 5'-end guanylyltransferase